MKIEIFNAEISEPDILATAISACTRWESCERAAIIVNKRVDADAPGYKNPGWVEYDVAIWRVEGSIPMRLGVIQRTPGAEIEVHS